MKSILFLLLASIELVCFGAIQATKYYVDQKISDVEDRLPTKSDVDQIVRQVDSIGAYLNAEDARFVVTNYDSKTKTPEAYVNINISNEWITIWREMTRWKKFTGSEFLWDNWIGFDTWRTNLEEELAFKATRNWGMYDSETGGLSPEGYTQISSPNIMIAANMAYQRTITTDGCNVWILQSNLSTTQFGGDTNGNFRILDGDGQVQFEVVKGDKSEQPCDSSGITIDSSTTPNTIKVPFSVESAEHPSVQICDKLETQLWKYEDEQDCIANVTWSGESGNWLASIQAKSTNQKSMFIKGTYMKGGETYIRNNAPVSMSSIILEEKGVRKKYYLGSAVIDGKTVLTLSTTP